MKIDDCCVLRTEPGLQVQSYSDILREITVFRGVSLFYKEKKLMFSDSLLVRVFPKELAHSRIGSVT